MAFSFIKKPEDIEKKLKSYLHHREYDLDPLGIENIICPKYDLKFYITQSWLTFTNPGGFHHPHVHNNSIISGVFYFNAEEGKDDIMFAKDRSYRIIDIERKDFNMYNCTSWTIPVMTGDLLIFPSGLEHSVNQTVSSNVRISLAFNVFVKGDLGGHERLQGLQI